MGLYGRNAGNLLKEMDRNASSFKEKPIGPLGMHVKIKEGKREWARPVELCLGQNKYINIYISLFIY